VKTVLENGKRDESRAQAAAVNGDLMKTTFVIAFCLILYMPSLAAQPATGGATNRVSPARPAAPGVRPDVRYRVFSVDAKTRQAIATNIATGSNALKRQPRPPVRAPGTAAVPAPSVVKVLDPETPESTNSIVLSSNKAFMPSIIVVPNPTNDVEITTELFVYAERVPLRWDTNLNAYSTPLIVGVDISDAQGNAALPIPLTFQIVASNCSVVPSRVTVTNGGTAGAQTTILTCPDPRKEPAISTFYDPLSRAKSLRVPCQRELGDIVVEAQQRSIFGYGLGTTRITISRLAKDHNDLTDPENLNLTVTTTKGILCGSPIIVSNECAAQIEFRSVGLGRTVITARVGPFSDSHEVECTFPLSLVIGTLLGGALGGFGRVFRKPELFKHKYRVILEGTVCGLLIFAAAAAGIVLFTFPPGIIGSELGAFVIAAIAGYTGSAILDHFKTVAKPRLDAPAIEASRLSDSSPDPMKVR
jgi:hypothetical protein